MQYFLSLLVPNWWAPPLLTTRKEEVNNICSSPLVYMLIVIDQIVDIDH